MENAKRSPARGRYALQRITASGWKSRAISTLAASIPSSINQFVEMVTTVSLDILSETRGLVACHDGFDGFMTGWGGYQTLAGLADSGRVPAGFGLGKDVVG